MRLGLSCRFYPFGSKAYFLIEIAYVALTVGSITQLIDKLIKFYARISFFLAHIIYNCYFHLY